ncbi:chemotaxis protein CheA [bacterium]|nr:chemotaxis protein CheA [bacterium]
MGSDMSDMMGLFLEEAEEQLLKLDDGFLQLEKNPGDIEILKEIFRAAHTLKGSSATMGLTEIARLTHAMENLLDPLRNGVLAVTPEIIDVLLEGTDNLRVMTGQVSNGEPVSAEIGDLLVRIKSLTDGSDDKPTEAPVEKLAAQNVKQSTDVAGAMLIRVKIVPECLMPSVRAFMVFNSLSMQGEVVSSEPSQDNLDDIQADQEIAITFTPANGPEPVIDAIKSLAEVELIDCTISDDDAGQVDRPVQNQQEKPKKNDEAPTAGPSSGSVAKAIQTVRVGVDRLDTLMNLVAELVIDRTRMNQIGSQLAMKYENEELVQGLGETSVHIGRVVNELQEHIMKVRLLPVEQVFNRFPRMVRDLSHKAGKEVDFILEGQETELDRSILEDIVDPLTHLLRNAVDHGVESPDKRAAAGKSKRARVVLAAKQEENRIIIEVQDDGNGISIEKVKTAALKNGAVSEETLARMTDEEALQLIFASGVSTAEKVTDVSGRGVGMDVVRSNIQGLSGNVEVHTKPGEGTTFRINLPLTLAIIQSLVTGVGDKVYVIPLSAVQETFRCEAGEIHHIDGHPAINFRGSVLHLVRLGQLFDHNQSIHLSDNECITFVVVRTGAMNIGLVVDKLIGEQEVVIKPLGSFFGDIDGVAGATILGDGRVALIVDVGAIGALINRRRRPRQVAETGVQS